MEHKQSRDVIRYLEPGIQIQLRKKKQQWHNINHHSTKRTAPVHTNGIAIDHHCHTCLSSDRQDRIRNLTTMSSSLLLTLAQCHNPKYVRCV